MKIICTQENFRKAVSITEKIAGKQITLPILENILLEAKKGVLKLAATNLEIGVVLKIRAKIESEGSIAIPSKILGSFVANLPQSETIELEKKDSLLRIASGSCQAIVKGVEAGEFPIIPEPESDPAFSLSAHTFKKNASRVLFCVAVSDIRPEFTGINMAFNSNNLSLAATDSFRLAEVVFNDVKKINDDIYKILVSRNKSVIVPVQAFSEVLRIIDEEDEEINISIEENQIFFMIGKTRLISRLINGNYPDYKHIIPSKFETQVILEKENFARAVKISSIFTSAKSGEIHLRIKDKKVIVKSQSAEAGENRIELPAKTQGAEQYVIFNPRYLFEGINAVATPYVGIFVNNSTQPVVIRMIDEKNGKPLEDFTYVVKPIDPNIASYDEENK